MVLVIPELVRARCDGAENIKTKIYSFNKFKNIIFDRWNHFGIERADLSPDSTLQLFGGEQGADFLLLWTLSHFFFDLRLDNLFDVFVQLLFLPPRFVSPSWLSILSFPTLRILTCSSHFCISSKMQISPISILLSRTKLSHPPQNVCDVWTFVVGIEFTVQLCPFKLWSTIFTLHFGRCSVANWYGTFCRIKSR